jgi:hypothetical protein
LPIGADAATYYVRNGGNDSSDGRTPATAWASLDKVNSHGFSAGDIVLFHEGDTFSDQLTVDWSGTSSQQAVVGAYYLDSGAAHRGFLTSRPVIDGRDKIPSSRYAPLVLVTGDRVRVENLSIVNSEGRGIVFDSVVGGQAVGLALSNILDGGIKFLDSQKGLAEGNSVTNTDRGYAESGGVWSAGISATRSSDTTIRGNRVVRVYGEGINVFENSPRSLIERNYVFGARAVGIYADASPDATIRYNIVLGTSESKFWRDSNSVGPGIVLNNEKYHYKEGGGSLSSSVQTRNAKLYGNLVAFTNEGIGIWGQLSSSSFDNTMIYNNTLVDNDVQFEEITNAPMPGSQFINNILLSLSSGARDVTKVDVSGLVAKQNYFSQGDPGGAFSGAGNKYKGIVLARMTDWRRLSDAEAVSSRDFEAGAGSTTIGAGNSAPLDTATSTNTYNLDFNLKPHHVPPDMGAISFGTHEQKVPGRPGNLATNAKDQT